MTSLYDKISRQRNDPNDPLGETNFTGDPTKARDEMVRLRAERDALRKPVDIDGAVAAYYSWPQHCRADFIGYIFPESVFGGGCIASISDIEIRQSAVNIMTWPASARSEFLLRISRKLERTTWLNY